MYPLLASLRQPWQKKMSLRGQEGKMLRGPRLKTKPILIWTTPHSAIINHFLSLFVCYQMFIAGDMC